MKSLNVLALVACLIGATSASADSMARYEYAKMTKLNLAESLKFSEGATAVVRVDYLGDSIKLDIVDMNQSRTIELPIVTTEQSCGSVIYTARLDQRPVDGLLQEITVQDNRRRTCRDLRSGMTEVTYMYEVPRFRNPNGADVVAPRPVESYLVGGSLSLHSIAAPRSAKLTAYEVTGYNQVVDAAIMIDTYRVQLSFLNDICPKPLNGGMSCLAMAMPIEVSLPVVETTDAGCGSKRIVAQGPNLVGAGVTEQIEIIDHSERLCNDKVAGEVVVTYQNNRSNSSVLFYGRLN